MSGKKRLFTYGTMVFGFAIAAYLLYRGLSQFTWDEIVQSVTAIPTKNLLLALAYCAGSYICLTGFDWTGVRYVKSDLPYPKIALASFVALGLARASGSQVSAAAPSAIATTPIGASRPRMLRRSFFCRA